MIRARSVSVRARVIVIRNIRDRSGRRPAAHTHTHARRGSYEDVYGGGKTKAPRGLGYTTLEGAAGLCVSVHGGGGHLLMARVDVWLSGGLYGARVCYGRALDAAVFFPFFLLSRGPPPVGRCGVAQCGAGSAGSASGFGLMILGDREREREGEGRG